MRRAQAGSGIVDIDGLLQGSVVHAEAGHHTHGPCVRIVVRGWQVSHGAVSTQAMMDGAPQYSQFMGILFSWKVGQGLAKPGPGEGVPAFGRG